MKRILILLLSAITMMAQAQTHFRELTFDQAVAAAKAENKMVFIDVMTSWCGPCKIMARDVFPRPAVGDYMNSHFVSIKIDAEKGEGVTIAKTYKVNAYPTFLLLDTSKREVARSVGMKQPDDFLAELERLINPDASPEKLKARYERGERTPQLVKDYAAYLMDQARKDRRYYVQKTAEAKAIVNDYYATLSDAQRLSPDNMFVYNAYTTSTEDAPAKFMTRNVKRFPAESQQDITTLIQQLYQREEYALLSHSKETTPSMLDTFSQELKMLGLNTDGHYDNTMRLMYAYHGDGSQYLALCRELFKQLTPTQQTGLIDSITRKYADADEATKKAASRVIREQLPDMDTQLLISAVMAVSQLEAKGH